MARFDSKVLKVSGISKETPFGFRCRLRDDALKSSLKRFGMLVPVLVTDARRPVVIAGHKRLAAARRLKMKEVPALVISQIAPKDAFLLNLVSNWKQGCSEVDRARALEKATGEFRFSQDEILALVMPLLGLPADRALLGLYRELDRCPMFFKDLVEDGLLPLRGVPPFLKFAGEDLDYFARHIGSRVKLTSSQWLQIGEWLSDVMKKTGKHLRALCADHKLFKALGLRGMDPRAGADRFFARVRRLRFPGYAAYHEQFEKQRAGILRDAKEFRLEPVQGFEEPGFELRARVRNAEELDRLLVELSRKRPALNSLFEITL